MVDAWGLLPPQLRREWKLLIIGDGEAKPLLEKKIEELGIGDSVELVGATNAVFSYFESVSVYCLSSRFEGLPMVLLEASAFRLPIVAFDCDTGPGELVEDNRNGMLVEAGEVNKNGRLAGYGYARRQASRAHEKLQITKSALAGTEPHRRAMEPRT